MHTFQASIEAVLSQVRVLNKCCDVFFSSSCPWEMSLDLPFFSPLLFYPFCLLSYLSYVLFCTIHSAFRPTYRCLLSSVVLSFLPFVIPILCPLLFYHFCLSSFLSYVLCFSILSPFFLLNFCPRSFLPFWFLSYLTVFCPLFFYPFAFLLFVLSSCLLSSVILSFLSFVPPVIYPLFSYVLSCLSFVLLILNV